MEKILGYTQLKRYKNLFEAVAAWDNLCLAAKKARKQKRSRPDVLLFEFQREVYLNGILEQIRSGSYRPGKHFSFLIFDPKLRLISAAPYPDRIVHHAINNVIEPIFERTFIYDSYACRKHKGQKLAMNRAKEFARKNRFVLRTDIRRYFPSIDHQILFHEIERKIGDRRLLNLIKTIIEQPYPGQRRPTYLPGDDLFSILGRRCGLPIGNQTSQLFANVYLNRADHFMKETLRVGSYLRYMDDIVLFGNCKAELWSCKKELENYLLAELRLQLHPKKTQVSPVGCGFPYLGFRLFPNRVEIPSTKLSRFRRRIRKLQALFERGELNLDLARHSLASYWGHFSMAGGQRLFRDIVGDYPFFAWLVAELKRLKFERNQMMNRQKFRLSKFRKKFSRSLRSH